MNHIQTKTFTRWINYYLQERSLKVDDITKDFHDGIKLINLLEILSGRSLGKYVLKCKMPFHNLGNINIALDFMLKTERIKYPSWDATDIMRGIPRILLSTTWMLIYHYELSPYVENENGNPKETLTLWLNDRIAPYNLQVDDYRNSFKDGKILSALINVLSTTKEIINVKELKDPLHDIEEAMKKAWELYRIPQLVDPEDMGTDEHTSMAYLCFFRTYYQFERPLVLCVEEVRKVADLFLVQDLIRIIVEYYSKSAHLALGAGKPC